MAFGAVVVGAALFGPMGALISIPIVAAIEAVIDTYGRRYELVGEETGVDSEPVASDGAPQEKAGAGGRMLAAPRARDGEQSG